MIISQRKLLRQKLAFEKQFNGYEDILGAVFVSGPAFSGHRDIVRAIKDQKTCYWLARVSLDDSRKRALAFIYSQKILQEGICFFLSPPQKFKRPYKLEELLFPVAIVGEIVTVHWKDGSWLWEKDIEYYINVTRAQNLPYSILIKSEQPIEHEVVEHFRERYNLDSGCYIEVVNIEDEHALDAALPRLVAPLLPGLG